MNTPVISVIVCTYNRADLLDKCLASLSEQRLPQDLFEVIVVDNGSTDCTADVMAAYVKQNGHIRAVTEKRLGLSYARNRGCDEAHGRYLAYFDDDVIIPPDHLSNAFAVIALHDPDILGGPVYPYFTVKKPWWFRDKYETRKFEEKSGFSKTCPVTGANYIIKKETLMRMGMFDPAHGATGIKLGLKAMGEERKVLDMYRNETPVADQKVYYALECYIKHHVAPYKMKFGYILWRHYFAGKTGVIMDRDVRGITMGRSFVVELSLGLPQYFVQSAIREIRANGVRGVDYVDILRWTAFRIGMIVEGFRLGLKRFIAQHGM